MLNVSQIHMINMRLSVDSPLLQRTGAARSRFGLHLIHWAAAGGVCQRCKAWSPVSFLALCGNVSQLFFPREEWEESAGVKTWLQVLREPEGEQSSNDSMGTVLWTQAVIQGLIGCRYRTRLPNAACVRDGPKMKSSHEICKPGKYFNYLIHIFLKPTFNIVCGN